MMEKSWKVLCVGLLCCELCNGLPINLENTVADSHTQLLTGLVAVLLTVCSVVFLAGCLCCQRRNGFKEFRDSPVVASTASNLDHGHVNPVTNGEFTIFTPLSPPHQNNNVFLANQQIITRTQEDYSFDDVDVSSWFNGTETDFPRIKLKYIKEIGKGWFGRVVEGAAQDAEQKWTPVVVRILESTASKRERVVFLHDAAIYKCGNHPNVLKLVGRCLDTVPLLLLQESCPQGDLKNYLRQNKATAEKLLSTEYPLIWCCQLSSALKHLHDNKLTHPDLAARNCQLTSNLTLKLGDYGLAVFRYVEDYYQGAPGVSVRWCAPETITYTSTTIQPTKVTSEANIWSLGVTMWEICECGEQPYASLSDDEVISQVLGAQKVRLARPKYQMLYTDYIFRLMQTCWTGSESRPAMAQIDLMLADLLQVYKHADVTMNDFDKRWESFKPNTIVKTDNHNVDDSSEMAATKPLSPSLNNLHGSLDNLLVDETQMESWLENVATKTGDMSFVRGLSDAIKDLDNVIALENTSSESSQKIEFKLGPFNVEASPNHSLRMTTSSGSETEEENWKTKIERGAYSEKVRQKSRSVADLMILTHIDPSESDSETPLPSLDYRANYKNVRCAPKQNLDVSLMFGSEGNLLSVQDTFQEELKKLQEERRDSLLFVPENSSQNSSETLLSDSAGREVAMLATSLANDSPSKRILQELNNTSEIKPANQVFNVFNVTIDKFSPVHLHLDEIINFNDDSHDECEVPKLADIIESDSKLVDYLNDHPKKDLSDSEDNSEVMYDSGVEGDRMESTESLKQPQNDETEADNTRVVGVEVPKLMDIIQNNDELMDYIIARYETESKANENFDSLEMSTESVASKTKHFLDEEVKRYDDDDDVHDAKIVFDLSAEQDEAKPNSLTHSSVFSSTPFGKKSVQVQELPQRDGFSSLNLNLFDGDQKQQPETNNSTLYSLETWDNFLGQALDDQNESQENEFFDSFTSEPQSLLFTENDIMKVDEERTFVVDEKKDATFKVDQELVEAESKGEGWDAAGGWFLHPQAKEVTGEMTVSSDTYVGFNVDDEIMAAIRTELLNKLPQAQGGSSGTVDDDDEEEWDSTERNEVFLRYNVYNTPLSPIPEESFGDDSLSDTPKNEQSDDESSDWSDGEDSPHGVVPLEPLHRHTPSQESCCSNDTLFNLEELTCIANDAERIEVESSSPPPPPPPGESLDLAQPTMSRDDNDESQTMIDANKTNEISETVIENNVERSDMRVVVDFLINEREHDCAMKTSEESNSESIDHLLLPFMKSQQVAPLPSPEDKPWKQLPASLLSYDKVIGQNILLPEPSDIVPESQETAEDQKQVVCDDDANQNPSYENVTTTNLDDFYNEADYVNIVNLENTKNSEFTNNKEEDDVERNSPEYGDGLIINNEEDERDIFGVLTDIRFSGPGDQMMTTSFSESNDLNDEQDWESGSDTRSSSSGEFIWKEGEHEESLKALRAAPQDVLEDIQPMEGIQEESLSESSGSDDDEDDDDDDAESPEFVPSAWDKYATPTKSALRSPEKTLEKTEKKKSKGVWFKKQKYHCVYEYPREPESPVLHNYDLWKSHPDYTSFDDWELDGSDPFVTPENSDECDFVPNHYQPKPTRNINMYQLSSIADFTSNEPPMDDEFFISSSAKPFDMIGGGGLTSQFFPGNWSDLTKSENATPDSGVEDITPADGDFVPQIGGGVQTLKQLASDAVKTNKKETRKGEMLGGLRHTRNKLKLDLPPSPSAFTSSKMFNIEPVVDPVINREKPTFTTFGKSRFLVQHVDTPEDQANKGKNVSFEALPYKPLESHIVKEEFEEGKNKGKVEIVRGEASLLDSADEDSGIESSTLERKSSSTV